MRNLFALTVLRIINLQFASQIGRNPDMIHLENSKGNSNGNATISKILTGLLAVVGITVAIYAPMSLRISSLEENQRALTLKIEKVEEDARLIYLLKTDMITVNRRLDETDNFIKWWYENIPTKDAKQDEKLEKLEWYVYGKGASQMFKDQPVYEED